MKVKRDSDGNAVIKEVDGNEMVVYSDGKKEETYYPPSMQLKIKEQAQDLADSEKDSDKELGKLRKDLRAWERVGPIKEVRAAVNTVKSLSEGDIDAAKLPSQLAEAQAQAEALQEKVTDLETETTTLKQRNYKLGVGNQVANAIGDMNLIDGVTPDQVLRLIDADNVFKEDGEGYVPQTPDGKPIMVVGEKGEARVASVKEALDQLLPEAFRKPSGAKGPDAKGDQTTPTTSGQVRTKADLKDPVAKAKFIDEHGLEKFQGLPLGSEPPASN